MYILDNEDNSIHEGMEISQEEVAILESLPDEIQANPGISYIAASDRKKITALIISNYHISRRGVQDTPTDSGFKLLEVEEA
jgi:hypothetical protein